MDKSYYKRNLPHILPENAVFFVTFRLANSLPRSVVEDLVNENEMTFNRINAIKDDRKRSILLRDERKRYFAKFDQLLDNNNSGSMWLNEKKIAVIAADAIHFRDKKEYQLFSYCIMPNHVHMLIGVGDMFVKENPGNNTDSANESYRLPKILQDLKKFTARESNKILGRNGQFWHSESYDHVVRNVKEFENITDYIAQNPVKAGLTENYKDWEFSFVDITEKTKQQVDEFFSRQ